MSDREDKEYGRTKDSEFVVKGTIGVPHPYMITAKLVGFTSDNYSGVLGEAAIRGAEEVGVTCGQPGCQLSYDEHEQAAVVHCYKEITEDRRKGFREFLKGLIPKTEADKLVGFVLVDHFSN